jgi:hypothetical protein
MARIPVLVCRNRPAAFPHTGVLPIPGAFAKQREILKAAAAPLQSIVYAT